MTSPRKHLATRWYGEGTSFIRCTCGNWQSDRTQTRRDQTIAHRAHRVDMGETVRPLKPTPAERLKAAEAAIERVRAVCADLANGCHWSSSDPYAGERVLEALDDSTEPAPATTGDDSTETT